MNQQNNQSVVRCEIHQREACVVDLDLSLLICEKCALFDPFYRHHHFIDKQQLPSHASTLYQAFKKDIESLNLYRAEGPAPKWKVLELLSKQMLDTKIGDINEMYDEMIAEIEKEREQKVKIVTDEIQKIVKQCSEEVSLIVSQSYQQLDSNLQALQQALNSARYLQITKKLADQSFQKTISSIEKDLSIIEIALKNKLNLSLLETSAVPGLDLLRKKTLVKDQLLLFNEQISLSQVTATKEAISWNTARLPMKQIFKRAQTKMAETQRLSTITSKQLNAQETDSDLKLKKGLQKVLTKEELKNLNIKSATKQIMLVGLNLGNKEALDALRKCIRNTLVTTVDLSSNNLSSEFISSLKRQRTYGKHLRKVVLKGINLEDTANLKKEGIKVDVLRQGKLKLGQVSVIV